MQIIIQEKEEWKDLIYKDVVLNKYMISSYGKIFNKYIDRLLLCHKRGEYLGVHLTTIDNVCKKYSVHGLVGYIFLDPPLISLGNEMQLNHKNGVKHDPNVANLEWCTQSENLKHAYKEGLYSGKRRKIPKNVIHYICKLICYGYNSTEIIKQTISVFDIKIHKNYISDIRRKHRHSKISNKYFMYTENNKIIPIDKYYITIYD